MCTCYDLTNLLVRQLSLRSVAPARRGTLVAADGSRTISIMLSQQVFEVFVDILTDGNAIAEYLLVGTY